MADFGEEEQVWNKEKDHHHHQDSAGSRTMMMRVSKDSSSSAWPIPAAPRKIPRANTTLTPSCYDDAKVVKLEGSSSNSSSSTEPMNIPDWSKIYGKSKSKKKGYDYYDDENGDDDGDGDDDMVPPHEWIARRLARTQISSFSMCEGMGRTLKGRDLSKVRNAILTKTGFIE
ncbi:protein S40-4-like [Arachis stenosperma]|uniref:protein S40-4-like n=1 Tax=Arachis stenosperma TaxID=217475 RepID=UPI0025ACA8FC|nr:protein S40-4-like [Arachis stenosperma]